MPRCSAADASFAPTCQKPHRTSGILKVALSSCGLFQRRKSILDSFKALKKKPLLLSCALKLCIDGVVPGLGPQSDPFRE